MARVSTCFASILSLWAVFAAAPVARAQSGDGEGGGGGDDEALAPDDRGAPVSNGEQSAAADAPPSLAAGPPDSYLPSLYGPIGLYRVSTGEVGPVDHLRLAIHGQFFRTDNLLVEHDVDTWLGGELAVGFTPLEAVEVFAAVLASSNRNVRPPEPMRRDPEVMKSYGDLILGGKAVVPFSDAFSVGAELGFRFFASPSALVFSPSATSLWLGPLATFDLRPGAHVPLRLHANASFYLDNSANLEAFAGATSATQEVAMFAYGVQKNRIRLAVALDVPLEQLAWPLLPFAEYHIEMITASADPAFAAYASRTNRDQQWVSLGVRARVFRGLTLDAGVDLALQSPGYQYGPPLPPYDVIFGAGFPFDIGAFKKPVVVTKTVEVPEAAQTGTVVGIIRGAEGKPVGGAVVSFPGHAHATVVTDPDGTFESRPLVPGLVHVVVTASGFDPGALDATVAAGGRTKVELSLVAKPATGNVRGHVVDRQGNGIAAVVRFRSGAQRFDAQADTSGAFSAALPVGSYTVRFEAEGWSVKDVPLDVTAGEDQPLDVVLHAPNPDVLLTDQAIALRVPIRFSPGAPATLPADVKKELDGVAELLVDHPEVRTLRVEAHWGGPGGKDAAALAAAKKLTQRQADAVKEYLVSHGAPADRIEATGKGLDSPLVPNLGPANQARNRRVDLIVAR